LGPRREPLAPGLRVHFHQKYALYYRYTDTELVIVRVLHGSRDPERLLRDGDA
jgi:plasmid stabilization system protein ParE